MTLHILKSQRNDFFFRGLWTALKCWGFLDYKLWKELQARPPPSPPPIHLCSVCSSQATAGQFSLTQLAPWLGSTCSESLVGQHLFLGKYQVALKSLSKHVPSASSRRTVCYILTHQKATPAKSLHSASSHFPRYLSASTASSPSLPQQPKTILSLGWFLTNPPPPVSYAVFHLHSRMQLSFWNEIWLIHN